MKFYSYICILGLVIYLSYIYNCFVHAYMSLVRIYTIYRSDQQNLILVGLVY